MANTVISQTRKAVVVDAVTKYEVTTTITDKGSFASPNVFLLQIIDAEDPKEDSLVRIAGLGDIEQYDTDREVVADAGGEFFLASQFTRRYDTLDVAIAAYQVIRDRINTLVKDFDKYTAEFDSDAVGATITWTLPLVDYTLLAVDVLNYKEKNTALVAASTALAEATKDVNTATTNLAAAEAVYADLVTANAVAVKQRTQVTRMQAGITGYETVVNATGTAPGDGWSTSDPSGGGHLKDINTLLYHTKVEVLKILGEIATPTGGGGGVDTGLISAAAQKIQTEETAYISRLGTYVTTVVANAGSTLTEAVLARDDTVDISAVSSALQLALTNVGAAGRTVTSTTAQALAKTAALTDAKTAADKALATVLDLCPDFDINNPDEKIADELT